MIAEGNNELLPLAERLRILEEKSLLLEPETVAVEHNPAPLPLPLGLAQDLLQEDRELLKFRP
jgi:hypothetical protein